MHGWSRFGHEEDRVRNEGRSLRGYARSGFCLQRGRFSAARMGIRRGYGRTDHHRAAEGSKLRRWRFNCCPEHRSHCSCRPVHRYGWHAELPVVLEHESICRWRYGYRGCDECNLSTHRQRSWHDVLLLRRHECVRRSADDGLDHVRRRRRGRDGRGCGPCEHREAACCRRCRAGLCRFAFHRRRAGQHGHAGRSGLPVVQER